MTVYMNPIKGTFSKNIKNESNKSLVSKLIFNNGAVFKPFILLITASNKYAF